MSTIHSSWVPEGASASEIIGSAKDSTVLSTATSSTGSMSTASAVHRRPAEDRTGERTELGAVSTGTSWDGSGAGPPRHTSKLYRPVGTVEGW
ncbi:hypothetical protein GCM10009793_06710 [Brachybacterium phenoliresistens]